MDVGISQLLRVSARTPDGFRVTDGQHSALLPDRDVPRGTEIGHELELFVYRDRDGALLTTPDLPRVQRGGFACLEVVDVAAHGAYMDWGLDRDLFVPGKLQFRPLRLGDRAVVAVDVDPEGRLYGSTILNPYLRPAEGLAPGDAVTLLVYRFTDLGAGVVVDGRFNGMIYRNETFRPVEVGETLPGWVKAIREDGRIDATVHRLARPGTLDAAETLWEALVANGGFLPLTDRSEPRRIEGALHMSKKVFKKAVGALYKDRRITLHDDGIRVVRG